MPLPSNALAPPATGNHPVPTSFHRNPVSCLVIGCGGNGARMLIRLATIDRALRALGHPGLRLSVCDGDLIERHNCVRQPFAAADVGLPKATVLASRINAAHGTCIEAFPVYATEETLPDIARDIRSSGILVGCVDTAKSRATIADYAHSAPTYQRPCYWLDLGNAYRSGQFVIGTLRSDAAVPLPTAAERWPEIADPHQDRHETDTASCSSAESLRRQDLFVNDMLTCGAAHLLWTLFRNATISVCGGFCNLESGRLVPIPVPAPDPEE